MVFSPPISHLATCAHLINVLLITSCKSLIRTHCRYSPISEPARSTPLATISQPAHSRPPAAHVAFQPGFREAELRTGSAEFIFQVRFQDASISLPSLTNVVEGFFLILLKNAIKFVSWNLLFKNPDSCLLVVALCS